LRPSPTRAWATTFVKRQANSLKAAESPSPGSGVVVRVATSVIRLKEPTGL